MESNILILLIIFFIILNFALGRLIYKKFGDKFQAQDDEIKKLEQKLAEVPGDPEELIAQLEKLNEEISVVQKRKRQEPRKKKAKNYEDTQHLQRILLRKEKITHEQLEKVQRFQKLNGINFENALSILGLVSNEDLEDAKVEAEETCPS